MKKQQFNAEFNRRLLRLYNSLDEYQRTGNIGSLLPILFSVCSYLWCRTPYKK